MCFRALLGSYLSYKANGSIARRVKTILWIQTSAYAWFLDFILPSKAILAKNHFRATKGLFLRTSCLDLCASKIYLIATSTQHVCLRALLASYLSYKANESIARRVKTILWIQTSANAKFLDFILPSKVFGTTIRFWNLKIE